MAALIFRPRVYRLYIDESGDHSFQCMDQAERRYLALMGIWFGTGEPYISFANKLKELKDEIFGPRPDDPLMLHRKDIVQRSGPFFRLRDPKVEARFNSGLLLLVLESTFTMCGVVVDKQAHQEKIYRRLSHPYHYCLSVLLERYVGLLNHINATGDVMAESRGKTEDKELKRAFGEFYESGTKYVTPGDAQRALTSKDIKLKKKENCIAGLELADILANPVRREIMAERCGEAIPDDFGSAMIEVARSKFNRQLYTGQIEGYGKVLLT